MDRLWVEVALTINRALFRPARGLDWCIQRPTRMAWAGRVVKGWPAESAPID